MTSQKSKLIFLAMVFSCMFSVLGYIIVMTRIKTAELAEGQVLDIHSWFGSRPAKATFQVTGYSKGWYVTRDVTLNDLPPGIRVYDMVKIIKSETGELTLEKIPDSTKGVSP